MAVDLERVPILDDVGGYVTVKAAAKALGAKNHQEIYYLVRSGQLKGAKLEGYIWLITKASLERYKARRAARAAETATN